MENEQKIFWWGYAGGALSALGFIFLVVFIIAYYANLPLRDSSILFMLASSSLAMMIVVKRLRDNSGKKSKRGFGRIIRN